MAPNKIYTCYNIEEGEKRQLWSTVLLSDVEQVGEYIRKDALLEFLASLEKDSARNAGTNDLAYAAHEMVCTLIDKIESL